MTSTNVAMIVSAVVRSLQIITVLNVIAIFHHFTDEDTNNSEEPFLVLLYVA